MRRLWLIFSQTATVALAILFVVVTLKPHWLDLRARPGQALGGLQSPGVSVRMAASASGPLPSAGETANSNSKFWHPTEEKSL